MVFAENLKITNSNIGISSKDFSSVTASNIELDNNKFGITVFQKKPEFGPASININNISIKNNQIPYLTDSSSICIVDNKKIKSISNENIKNFIYTEE